MSENPHGKRLVAPTQETQMLAAIANELHLLNKNFKKQNSEFPAVEKPRLEGLGITHEGTREIIDYCLCSPGIFWSSKILGIIFGCDFRVSTERARKFLAENPNG